MFKHNLPLAEQHISTVSLNPKDSVQGWHGRNRHTLSLEIAQKFIKLFETFVACHLMLNGKEEFDEARINKFSM